MSWIENRFEEGVIVTSLDWAINWARKCSIWPMTFGLACCAIEMMSFASSRFDVDRFGAGAFRFKHGYHVVKGVDLVVPVDIYVPGCPPRPEALQEGLMRLMDKIDRQTIGMPAGARKNAKTYDIPMPAPAAV